MCGSMVDIQSPTTEISRGKKEERRRKKKPQDENIMVCPRLLHRATITRMWAYAERDGRPVEYKWCPLFNAAKFG